MRRTSKAATAGPTKRLGRSKPALLLCVLAASVAALALVVGSASGATTRFLVEAFGSSAQPAFPADRGMAYDQGANHLYVIDSTNDTISRFNADGTAADFGALGSNAIDGVGAGDETPLGHLAFEANRQREQLVIDESGGATDGNIYATRSASDVVDVFSSSGEYKGTLSESTGTGAFGEPCGVAVDAAGNVYVGDRGDDRIHVYEPAGAVPVNADNTASFATVTDPCTLAAGAGATAGFLFVNASTGAQLRKVDATTGEVKYEIATGGSTVSVDPVTGHVFLARNTGSSSQVDEYDASGAASATLVSSFKPGQTVEGIALNSGAEQVYVARSGTEAVEVFGPAAVIPDVVTSPPSSNTGVRATLAGTVNPDGVELDECFFEWGKATFPPSYGTNIPCAESPVAIGAGTSPVAVHADIDGLQPNGTSYDYRLVAVNPNGSVSGLNQIFKTPDTVVTIAASGLGPTTATLNGTVNPDGTAITECLFEWGQVKGPLDLLQTFPQTVPCDPGPGGIGSGTAPVPVEADLSGLHPGTSYAYRLKATNANGAILGKVVTTQTTGPVVAATWSESVVYTEATLRAEIDPEGEATTYHFEYGPTTSYGSQTPELSVGADSSVHKVTRFLDDLEPDTTYHYRVVASNSVATNEGPDLTFNTYERFVPKTDCPNQTFRTGPSQALPDCRAYEMVSPVDKNGGDIATLCNINCNRTAFNKAARDGGGITYSSHAAFGDTVGAPYSSQYMSTREDGGWSTHALSPPRRAGLSGAFLAPFADLEVMFKAFTDDLSTAWLFDNSVETLTPDALQGKTNYYSRSNASDSYETLTVDQLGTNPSLGIIPEFQGYSADGKVAFFGSVGQLTANATGSTMKIYASAGGGLSLVSVLPDGTPAAQDSYVGGYPSVLHPATHGRQALDNAVTTDGARVFWSAPQGATGGGAIYVRENPTAEQSALDIEGNCTEPTRACTRSVGAGNFWTAAKDGSGVLFSDGEGPGSSLATSGGVLKKFAVESEATTTIAGEISGVLGASDDLSYVYFVSKEDLAAGAIEGQQNLYLDRSGEKHFIASLSPTDTAQQGDDVGSYNIVGLTPTDHNAMVTPDGHHAAFQSERSLTGYDSVAANNGELATEVFVYDADSARLSCASCKPSGARPTVAALQEPHKVGNMPYNSNGGSKRVWAAAWLPTAGSSLHTPYALSDDGNRVFFNSFDALVPTDSNGAQDVYQWEAQGSGTCDRPDGCIDLISTGQSPEKSEFVDAGVDGAAVFFETNSSIAADDPGLIDIYAAQEGGGFPPPPPGPPPCVGDACQSPPSAPNDPTPSSAGFRGAGDPPRRPDCRSHGQRAAKLSRQAKQLRRAARHSKSVRRTKQLRRHSTRLARNGKRLSRKAKRCRRASRRAAR